MDRFEFKVAGISFVKASVVPTKSSIVSLDLEPTNPYDKDAVSVSIDSVKVGYVPAAIKNRKEFVSAHSSSVVAFSHLHEGAWNDKGLGVIGSAVIEVFIDKKKCSRCGEIKHYEKDGKKYCRITSILSKICEQFVSWSEEKLIVAARYGNIVHKLAEAEFRQKGKGFASSAVDELLGNDWKPSLTESTVFNDDLMIAGTFDAMALCGNGDKHILDWKSSRAAQEKHKIQAAFYAVTAGAKTASVVCFGSDAKKGYSLSKVDIDKYYDVLLNKLKT